MQAMASSGGAQGAASSPGAQEAAATAQAVDESQGTSTVGQEQDDQASSPGSGKSSEAVPASEDEGPESAESQANATRGNPADEAKSEQPAARKAKALSRAPASDSIITSASLSTTTFNNNYSSAQLTMDFSLPDGRFTSGDTSTIQLPEGFKFVSDYDFDVKSSDGATVARAHIDAQAGAMTLTYTDYVENHSDVTGSITASVTTNRETIGDFGKRQFDLNVDGTIVPVGEVDYEKWTGDNPNEVITKWGNASNSADGTISYTIRVNGKGENISDAVVSDVLKSAGMSYVDDSFKITRGTLRIDPDTGGYYMDGEQDVTSQFPVEFNSDRTSFHINLGDIGTDGFFVRYKVKPNHDPVNQEKFQNTVGLTGSDGTVDKSYDNTVVWQSASGEANGYNYSIAIKKTDESGAPLAGAVFSVVRDSTGAEVGAITTAADGTGSLGGLLRDAYTVRETTPPEGYTAAENVHVSTDDLNNDAKTATVTIADRKIETVSIPVAKKWAGPEGGAVTVHLLADGDDTGKTITLDKDGGWRGSFDGLRKVAEDGHEIAYTVSEDSLANYSAEVAGDAASGFTITNKNTETVSIPVKKDWVGPEGSEVTVKLLADGSDSGKELKLSDANGWKGEFAGLAKYKDDGSEIKYSVTESEVSGVDGSKYATSVAGDAASGFTITNKNTETVDVSGTKTWNDDNDRDGVRPRSINVNLLADGTEVAEKTVTADDGWAYSFDRLPKYSADDGHEITYTVTEDAVANYATAISGTSIANSYTPGKTSITVSKAWADANDQDGMRPDSVKVQLYANGVASGDPATLDADNGWTHTWTGLFMKDGGKDIVYAVQEVGVPAGYTAAITGDAASGFTVTNAHEPETVSVPVTKKWIGGEGGAVTIRLLADGADTGKTISLDKAGGWAGSFDGLPKFKDGNQISYTVAEDAVEGYTSEISGDAASGFTVTNTKDETPGTPGSPSQGKSGGAPSLLPKTGDDTVAPIALLAAALVAGAAGLVARRKASSSDRDAIDHARHLRG